MIEMRYVIEPKNGIGKRRLLEVLDQNAGSRGVWLRGHASSYGLYYVRKDEIERDEELFKLFKAGFVRVRDLCTQGYLCERMLEVLRDEFNGLDGMPRIMAFINTEGTLSVLNQGGDVEPLVEARDTLFALMALGGFTRKGNRAMTKIGRYNLTLTAKTIITSKAVAQNGPFFEVVPSITATKKLQEFV